MKLQLNWAFTQKEEVILSPCGCWCPCLGVRSCLSPGSWAWLGLCWDPSVPQELEPKPHWVQPKSSLSHSSFCLRNQRGINPLFPEQSFPFPRHNKQLGCLCGVIPAPAAPQSQAPCPSLGTSTQTLSQRTEDSLGMEGDRVVRALLDLPLLLLGALWHLSLLWQWAQGGTGTMLGLKEEEEPAGTCESRESIPEEQNWEERTGRDSDPKKQAEQDSPTFGRSLIQPQIIFFLLK